MYKYKYIVKIQKRSTISPRPQALLTMSNIKFSLASKGVFHFLIITTDFKFY